jgi:hypothetical protein
MFDQETACSKPIHHHRLSQSAEQSLGETSNLNTIRSILEACFISKRVMLESYQACVYSTLDLQALIYQVTVETLLPLGQIWKLIPKEVKVAAITSVVTFDKGMFTYDEIENKLHENLKNRRKNLGKRIGSKVNNDERGEILFQETGS